MPARSAGRTNQRSRPRRMDVPMRLAEPAKSAQRVGLDHAVQGHRPGEPSLDADVSVRGRRRHCCRRVPLRASSGRASPAPRPARAGAPDPATTAFSSRWPDPPVESESARRGRDRSSGGETKRRVQRSTEANGTPGRVGPDGLSAEPSRDEAARRSGSRGDGECVVKRLEAALDGPSRRDRWCGSDPWRAGGEV